MSNIKITKPPFRWLFGGVGFHNSEATMTPIMSEKFKNEVIYKTFCEISPTYSRVFAGYADWTRESMDAFADYYDKTFRKSGTLLYLVPGRMPYITSDFDIEEYCEKVAENLEYLVKERKCTKIRYYCVTNELSVGNTYAYLANHLDLFKELHECLYRAFIRHDLDIGLLATDCSGVDNFKQIKWALDNMDEITNMYCAHLYVGNIKPGDLNAYKYFYDTFAEQVNETRKKQKRFVLGEYGINASTKWSVYTPMRDDTCYCFTYPEEEGMYAIAICEMAMAAINCGCFSTVFWTMFDYPDPFIREDGDTPEEKARYDVSRFSGAGLEIRYNKNGLIRWCDDEKDYSARASLYTLGHLARLFRKGSRVLEVQEPDDKYLRCSAITNSDGSMSIAVINWEDKEKNITLEIQHTADKPFRKYDFTADDPPHNKFNDLQTWSEESGFDDGMVNITVKPKSITFLTTDYMERTPSAIKNIVLKGNNLTWDKCKDAEHAYYRVYSGDKKDFVPSYDNQIASTVAENVQIKDNTMFYKVLSVDKYGNT